MISGETVTVWTRGADGEDEFGEPVEAWTPTVVDNVLVRPLTGADLADALRPDGVRVQYSLAFPKDYDGPDLRHAKVALTARGKGWDDALDVSGSPDALDPCPTRWNMLVEVGRTDG